MENNICIADLSLEEKAALLQGWSTWTTFDLSGKGIHPVFLSDGPTGLRKQAGAGDHLGLNMSLPATCFPTAATMANSWDTDLEEALGRALGEEAAAQNVHVLLGPGLNLKRSPLCGRNFEYFSEDPCLSGKMAAALIRGIQSQGVIACPKHFAVNSQELRRMSMDAVIDERTMRELYLTGFEIAVQEGGAKAIMSSYNRVNGVYANENEHLLSDILRKEWGFEGFVVSDWGGDNDHVAGVAAGANLVMPAPGPDCAIRLVEAVRRGDLPEETVDARVQELVRVTNAAYRAVEQAKKSFDPEAHHRLAQKCAESSIVLLENDGILPLNSQVKLAVIGDFAKVPRYQGAGSSMVNPTRLENLLEQLKRCSANIIGFEAGFSRKDPAVQPEMVQRAQALAKNADAVLLCIGLDEIAESEGADRNDLCLSPGQRALTEAVCHANANVILVLSGGAPFLLPPRRSYRAAIHGYLGGQAGAAAMAEALFGRVDPSGRLNESWPESLQDTPAAAYYPSPERTSEYREGPFVGYRYYDTARVPVRYPFGHGLSYTTFSYSDLHAEKDHVRFTLTNTGSMDGAEVVQVYVSCRNSQLLRPKKELKAFTKVFLAAGASETVTIPLDRRAFRYFHVQTGKWETETAEYVIQVAASAEDVKLQQTIFVEGTDAPVLCEEIPSYKACKISDVPDAEFERLLGHPIPDGAWSGELTKNDALCQMYYAKTGAARMACKILRRKMEKAEEKGTPDLNILFLFNMPFRAIGKMTGGMVSEQMVDDLVFLVNGHFWRGAGRFLADFVRNLRANRKFKKRLEEQVHAGNS